MLIDLHNFFKHYDEKNPKHVAAVEQFEKDLLLKSQELIQDDANWVRIFRTKEDKPQATILPVPFGVILRSIFVSPPVVEISGAFPVAAFAIVNSFTADVVAVNIISR